MAALYVPDVAVTERFTQSAGGPVQNNMATRAFSVAALARRQVGVDTGRLKSSIGVSNRRQAGLIWRIGSSEKHALVHHQGAKRHVILPKRARVLRFTSRGRVVYAHIVHHPGTRPNRYLSDQLIKVVR